MDSLARMLGILDLYGEGRSSWSAEDVAARLGCSKQTAYRYLKTLTTAGLLAPGVGGGYELGARIIELDRTMRLTDPLLARAGTVMDELGRALNENLLLCGFYGDKLITTAQVWPHPETATSYARGRPMPLLRGAAGKAILAHLPAHRLRSMMLRDPKAIAESGLGDTWPAFRDALRAIRRRGYSFSSGEIDPGIVGIAAPVFGGHGQVVASIVLAIPHERVSPERIPPLAQALREAACRLSNPTGDMAISA